MTATDRDEACLLIVDDEEDARSALRELVEMDGCSALEAANGREALSILESRRPCLIVLDLLMPVMTGNELIEAMAQQPAIASVPVVITTSAPSYAPRGFPVLPKPIDIQALRDWIQRLCDCANG